MHETEKASVPLINYLPFAATRADEDEAPIFVFGARVLRGSIGEKADVIIGQKNDDVVGVVSDSPIGVIGDRAVTGIGKLQKNSIILALKFFKNQLHSACDVLRGVDIGAEFFNVNKVESSAGGEG